jgi:hypothetical protein
LCVDTAESGAEWPFVRVNPAFVQAQFVYTRESCICAGLRTRPKYRNVCAQTESGSGLKPEKKNPHMIPNRANEKNVTRKGFLRLTSRKRPRTPNTGVIYFDCSPFDILYFIFTPMYSACVTFIYSSFFF